MDCCFSELGLWKSKSVCWSSTKQSSSSSHWKLTCSRHDIAETIAELALRKQSLTHSLSCIWYNINTYLFDSWRRWNLQGSYMCSHSPHLRMCHHFDRDRDNSCWYLNIDWWFVWQNYVNDFVITGIPCDDGDIHISWLTTNTCSS